MNRNLSCKTKYPIMLVHGVFLRDDGKQDPWGNIPAALTERGALCFHGNQSAVATVKANAKELKHRVYEILEETGSEKINIIAHSKGGLDSRYMISMFDMGDKVASLTTINTPHRGCRYVSFLLRALPSFLKDSIVRRKNEKFKRLGDEFPDYLGAIEDLSSEKAVKLDKIMRDDPRVFYQRFGTSLTKPLDAQYPLCLYHSFIMLFDGKNDGLAGESSLRHGKYTYVRPKLKNLKKTGRRKRGFSHWDISDWKGREYIRPAVIRFYTDLVNDLKDRGF